MPDLSGQEIGQYFYAWMWLLTDGSDGGYNWCRANSRSEALAKGNAFCTGRMVVDEATLCEGDFARDLADVVGRRWLATMD